MPTDTGNIDRRLFLQLAGAGSLAGLLPQGAFAQATPITRPNILWITSEDNSPYLGCYGDPVAQTPALDGLAAEGTCYDRAYSNAAVCAPARQTIITGMYATSIGGQHMRSKTPFPVVDGKQVTYFPAYLRRAGYYTSNNKKEDYNGAPPQPDALEQAWNESSKQAHWRNRPAGQPFFSVFNFTETHESNLFRERPIETDPARVTVPPYLPDTAVVRKDLAHYYDRMAVLDGRVASLLADLKADGLWDDTIVFYFSDHGGSMARGKSHIYESGTRVPMIVRFPERWRHLAPTAPGGQCGDIVSFVDLAPTVLSLAGLTAPAYMQGRAFLGKVRAKPPQSAYLFRGRRGERYDLCRGLRRQRWKYIRNFTPHVPTMQHNGYAWRRASNGAWEDAVRAGRANAVQRRFFLPKEPEELYDMGADPHETRNLAMDPANEALLQDFRAELRSTILRTRDSVFCPEGMTGRSYETFADDTTYPLEALYDLAVLAGQRDPANLDTFIKALQQGNPCLRYWGAYGCFLLGKQAQPARTTLLKLVADEQDDVVRVAVAEAVAALGDTQRAGKALVDVLQHAEQPGARLQALTALEATCLSIDTFHDGILAARKDESGYVRRLANYLSDVLENRRKRVETAALSESRE